jgi:hypothetical protein
MIETVPGATAVTRPDELTDARVESLDAQTTERVSGRPQRSNRATVAWVVCPTCSVLETRVTRIVATPRLASAERSPAFNPSGAVALFEHERLATSDKRASTIVLGSLRFTGRSMNRATVFNRVARHSPSRHHTPAAGNAREVTATGNAAGTARIYVRQARRSYRHSSKR